MVLIFDNYLRQCGFFFCRTHPFRGEPKCSSFSWLTSDNEQKIVSPNLNIYTVDYEEYLKKIDDLAKRVTNLTRDDLPARIKSNAQRALYRNLGKNEELAISVDTAVRNSLRADWRGNIPSENEIKYALYKVLNDKSEVERIFQIVKQQNEY